MGKPTTIAARLFLLVFGGSVAWISLSTATQMAFEYGRTRSDVDANLQDLFVATSAGLESALWNYDTALVESSLNSTRTVGILSGAQVRNERQGVLASWGEVPQVPVSGAIEESSTVGAVFEPLIHRFPLYHNAGTSGRRIVGELILVTSLPTIQGRLAGSLELILGNYVATTVVLLIMLLVGLNRRVAGPLKKITSAIGTYRFDRADLPVFDERPGRRPDELSVLWKSFEDLTHFLKESYLQQRVMSSILEEAAVMALVCDADGQVVSSNAQARVRLLEGHPGGNLANLAYGNDTGPLFDNVPALLAAGKSLREELTVRNDQGQTFWLSTALIPLEVPDKPSARWGVMIEDISAKKLTERYRQERDLAQQATRAKGLFLANLSHEIRTPMNAVVGLTALALDEAVSPRAKEYLSQLKRSGAALLGVINDILDFSKLEEGKLELESVDFSITTLIDSVDAMARFKADEKGLIFSIKASPRVPPILKGDGLRLQQVLLNLVANAIKFTEKGSVEVSLKPLPAADFDSPETVRLRFEVLDTGIGIAAEDQQRLFQSFTQVDASTTRVYGGTGLGLAICRQLIVLMGGTLGVQSSPGQGSLFWFELTLSVGQALPELPRALWNFEGLRVLLAEDNKVNQLVAREILAKVGVQPVVVSNGLQAVDSVESQAFDLVLMDLQMPVMDGLEATRIIRLTRDAASLPILALTAHTFAEELETCVSVGMQDLVPKPVDPEDLYQRINRWRPAVTKP